MSILPENKSWKGVGPHLVAHTFTLNRRMNSGAKVCSSRIELQAFVKDYIFFLRKSVNNSNDVDELNLISF